ncbi:Ser/Thr protein kinase RdoA (MazF antagonist) [Pedobacter sp. UYP24]
MLNDILKHYQINATDCLIEQFGTGLINHTWKVTYLNKVYILQRINTAVFKKPENIDNNLRQLKAFFETHYPEYLFAGPLVANDGSTTVIMEDGHYRLQPFIIGSHTIDAIETPEQAYQAAKQFGQFSRLLNNFNSAVLTYTLPDFHNLALRIEQFNEAMKNADSEHIAAADAEIAAIQSHLDISEQFNNLLRNKTIPLRVIHHDTKISNVLFNEQDQGLCVIDLDTVMPGYFISDVGDMMRTYLCAATEEERDLSKISIRKDVFKEIYNGYMEEMGNTLSPAEKSLFTYSGELMIFMQALRFLTDFLNKDIYYPIKYPEHNLMRSRNQLTLLSKYIESEKDFKIITG